MVNYDPSKRPTIEELKSHPWMQSAIKVEKVRSTLLDKLDTGSSQKTQASENIESEVSRKRERPATAINKRNNRMDQC